MPENVSAHAKRRWRGKEAVSGLAERGILIRSNTWRGVAEEARQGLRPIGPRTGA